MCAVKGRTLVVGGDGFIGRALTEYLRNAGEDVTPTTIEEVLPDKTWIHFDITQDIGRSRVLEDRYDVAFICSAITSLDECARNPVATAAINVEGVTRLAKHLFARSTYIVFFSSNQVFDGSRPFPPVTEPVSPVTEYGRQKAKAESAITGLGGQSLILRMTKVLGGRQALFEQWAAAIRQGQDISPFSDMYMAPVPVTTVLSVLRLAVDKRTTGILHVSGDRDISYADIARMLAEKIGIKDAGIKPVSWRVARPSGEPFPIRTALDTTRLRLEFGIFAPESEWVIKNSFSDKW